MNLLAKKHPIKDFSCTAGVISPFTGDIEWISVPCSDQIQTTHVICEKIPAKVSKILALRNQIPELPQALRDSIFPNGIKECLPKVSTGNYTFSLSLFPMEIGWCFGFHVCYFAFEREKYSIEIGEMGGRIDALKQEPHMFGMYQHLEGQLIIQVGFDMVLMLSIFMRQREDESGDKCFHCANCYTDEKVHFVYSRYNFVFVKYFNGTYLTRFCKTDSKTMLLTKSVEVKFVFNLEIPQMQGFQLNYALLDSTKAATAVNDYVYNCSVGDYNLYGNILACNMRKECENGLPTKEHCWGDVIEEELCSCQSES